MSSTPDNQAKTPAQTRADAIEIKGGQIPLAAEKIFLESMDNLSTGIDVLGIEAFEAFENPRDHRDHTVARLVLNGMKRKKAEDLYRSTMEAKAKAAAVELQSLDKMTEPALDTLTCSLKGVPHDPASARAFLVEYIAPVNTTTPAGWRWERTGSQEENRDQGNRFYHQSAHIFYRDDLIGTLFFGLKAPSDDQNFCMLDCQGGDPHTMWQLLREHVDALGVSISRADVALDIVSHGAWDGLYSLCHMHRFAWTKSRVPGYGSYNIDAPARGRTAYWGKVPGTKGGRAGTFTVRLYEKGIEQMQKAGPEAVEWLDDVRDWIRIECQANPKTPDEKTELARMMVDDLRSVWGYSAFTHELLELIEGQAGERMPHFQKEPKAEGEKLEWLLTTYKKTLKGSLDGMDLSDLLSLLHTHCGVRIDLGGLLRGIEGPDPSDIRSTDYERTLAKLVHLSGAHDPSYSASEARNERELDRQEWNNSLEDWSTAAE